LARFDQVRSVDKVLLVLSVRSHPFLKVAAILWRLRPVLIPNQVRLVLRWIEHVVTAAVSLVTLHGCWDRLALRAAARLLALIG
jgi:hypothetical protein